MLNLGLNIHRIVKLKYQSGASIERHKHDFYHYIYVIGGSGEIVIDLVRHRVSVGSLYLVPQQVAHEIHCEKDLTTVGIKFTCNPACAVQLNSLDHCLEQLSLYEENIIKGILGEAMAKEPYFEEVINIRFSELIMRFLRKRRANEAKMTDFPFEDVPIREEPTKVELRKVIEYIDGHIDQPLSVSELAYRFGYSESYFCVIFKKTYGISPNKYINQLKINKAKSLMLHSNLNVSEIAELLGYEHVPYFSRLFKKITSSSPQDYIRKLSEDIVVNVDKESVFIPATRYEHQEKLRTSGKKTVLQKNSPA